MKSVIPLSFHELLQQYCALTTIADRSSSTRRRVCGRALSTLVRCSAKKRKANGEQTARGMQEEREGRRVREEREREREKEVMEKEKEAKSKSELSIQSPSDEKRERERGKGRKQAEIVSSQQQQNLLRLP